MSEQTDRPGNEISGWPPPSPEVLRELEPPALVRSDSEPAANWPLRPTARG
jgi:hypothetical protein